MKKEDADVIFCETALLAQTGLTGIHMLQQLYLYVWIFLYYYYLLK